MCLFALLAAFFPRIAFALYWLARPDQVARAFGDMLLWPLLGLLFLPFTTLFYSILWQAGGLSGWDWLWVFIAFLLDLAHYASGGWFNRDKVPGYAGAGSAGPSGTGTVSYAAPLPAAAPSTSMAPSPTVSSPAPAAPASPDVTTSAPATPASAPPRDPTQP